MKSKKIAVVLQNLGGPDSLQAVKPFLFNLFSDKAIIGLPQPFRWLVAKMISRKRDQEAQHIYQQIGGKSPLLEETLKQAKSLEAQLNGQQEIHYKVVVAMRYWHPLTTEAYQQVLEFQPDQVILLPLYPQFSTTTSASSIQAWKKEAKRYRHAFPTKTVCCYYQHPAFIEAHVDLLRKALESLNEKDKASVRILFSAHGLPQKIVDSGDPYQMQIEATCQAIVDKLGISSLDWNVCYQSKVGPLAWLTPATESSIREAAKANKAIVVVPVAFVSEHSETLVELDIEYRQLALAGGAKSYTRVQALGCHAKFIEALTSICYLLQQKPDGIYPQAVDKTCGYVWTKCPCQRD